MKKLLHFLGTFQGKVVAGIILVIALLFAYYFYATGGEPVVREVVISESDHVKGAQDGKVTLVEFGDFQCPACAAYEPLVRQALVDNAKDLKVVYRHFPLSQIHPHALLAAKASEAAGVQGKFWEMHDMLFDKQKEWSAGLNARDVIIGYAKDLKLDTAKFSADLNNKSIEEKVLAEFQEGVKLGVSGTPTFFINGKKIENPRNIEEFNKLIKEALAQ